MNKERYTYLLKNLDARLTDEELADGWFFCCTWDFLLVQQGDGEAQCCGCMQRCAMPPKPQTEET